ncbi:MAG: hypothetical protein WBM47_14695, partial [Polyangiales bacterium]
EPHLHAVGADYQIPGHLLSLVDEEVTLTVGLGGDQIGYFVPVSDYRLKCLNEVLLFARTTCKDLYARGVIQGEDWLSGDVCQRITDDEPALEEYGDDAEAIVAICRYGQALGRELGEPDGHYEETNAAGWDIYGRRPLGSRQAPARELIQPAIDGRDRGSTSGTGGASGRA